MKFLITGLLIVSSLTVFASNRESGGRISASAVYVDFFSIGTGINYEAFSISKKLLGDATSQGRVYETTVTPWGREGEVKVCIHFKDVLESRNFIKDIAPSILNDSYIRTRVLLWTKCGEIEHATPQDLLRY